MTSIQPHPGQDSYPDLEKSIPIHQISSNNVAAEVRAGLVTFTDSHGNVIDISEWDLGNFIDTWFRARFDQRPYISDTLKEKNEAAN